MKFRNRFSDPVSVGLKFEKPSLTKSEFAQDCDLNTIVARYRERGIDLENQPSPQFDASAVNEVSAVDLQESLNLYNEIDDAFSEVPAADRLKFGNDPLAWFADQQEQARQKAAALQEKSQAVEPVPTTEPVAPSQASTAEVGEQ